MILGVQKPVPEALPVTVKVVRVELPQTHSSSLGATVLTLEAKRLNSMWLVRKTLQRSAVYLEPWLVIHISHSRRVGVNSIEKFASICGIKYAGTPQMHAFPPQAPGVDLISGTLIAHILQALEGTRNVDHCTGFDDSGGQHIASLVH